jgi:hypothetical protein
MKKGHFVCFVRQASFVCCIVVNAAMSWLFHYNMFPLLKIPYISPACGEPSLALVPHSTNGRPEKNRSGSMPPSSIDGVISVRTRCHAARYRSSEHVIAMSSIARRRLERPRSLLELSDLSISNHGFFYPGVPGRFAPIPTLFPDGDFALSR